MNTRKEIGSLTTQEVVSGRRRLWEKRRYSGPPFGGQAWPESYVSSETQTLAKLGWRYPLKFSLSRLHEIANVLTRWKLIPLVARWSQYHLLDCLINIRAGSWYDYKTYRSVVGTTWVSHSFLFDSFLLAILKSLKKNNKNRKKQNKNPKNPSILCRGFFEAILEEWRPFKNRLHKRKNG